MESLDASPLLWFDGSNMELSEPLVVIDARRILPVPFLLVLACSVDETKHEIDVGFHAEDVAAPSQLTNRLDARPAEPAADEGLVEPVVSPSVTVETMTINLRNAIAADGENAWTERVEMVIGFLADAGSDLIGTQEAWIFQLTVVAQALPEYEWTGVSRLGSVVGEYCAIFYRADRFAAIDSGTFWLSESPEVPNSRFTEEQSHARIATWVHLSDREASIEFFVFNTHFSHLDHDEIPERSAAVLVRKLEEIAGDAPVVVLGDFNTRVYERAYGILTGTVEYAGVTGSLVDPWAELDLADEGTFHGFTGEPESQHRIDWILHSGHYAPVEVEVERYHENGRYLSDHFPVSARLTIASVP